MGIGSFWPLGKRGLGDKTTKSDGHGKSESRAAKKEDDDRAKKRHPLRRRWFPKGLLHRGRKRGSPVLAQAGTINASSAPVRHSIFVLTAGIHSVDKELSRRTRFDDASDKRRRCGFKFLKPDIGGSGRSHEDMSNLMHNNFNFTSQPPTCRHTALSQTSLTRHFIHFWPCFLKSAR
jgi:hypothetical protein